MSTNQNNQQQLINNAPLYSAFGPQQFMDIVMNKIVFSKMSNMIDNNNFKLTGKNMIKLLALMSINEIKSLFIEYLKTILDYVKKIPSLSYQMLCFLFKNISLIRNKGKTKNNDNIDDNKCNDIIISITVNDNFMYSLYNYITTNTKCNFIKSMGNIDIKNNKEIIFCEIFQNIIISHKSYKLKIIGEIMYKKNIYNNELTSLLINIPSGYKEKKRYIDLLPSALAKIVDETCDKICKACDIDFNNPSTIENWINDGYKKLPNTNITINKKNFEMSIAKMITSTYPDFNLYKTLIELIALTTIFASNNVAEKYYNRDYVNDYKKKQLLTFDIYNNYPIISFDSYAIYYETGNKYNTKNEEYMSAINEYTSILDKLINEKSSKKESGKKIDIVIEKINNNDINDDTFNQSKIIETFITKVNRCTPELQDNVKVKIFYLTIESEKQMNEDDNPEYIEWKEKKELLEKMNKDEKNTFSMFDFRIPPKKIKSESYIKKVVYKQLNEASKTFDTLYLRKNDKELLSTSLSQFKNKKDIIKSLGLQNKLNILLHGEPGTGKSTTIQAIATFLNKDIYYVDLKNAATNDDLQIMFEYVNKNVQNGGIIVIEDIDAMTNSVLKRTTKTEELKINDIIGTKNNTLTLEYLLNILQGTLTMDDSIFIVTTNHIEKLDPAFYRDGRFDVKLKLQLCDRFQINAIYNRIIGRDIPNKILDNISENKHSPASIIFHVKNYMFMTNATDEEILERFIDKIDVEKY
jgi:SpoVK/Ycf46/Vps4 family AAA+-type ATPase